jgi:hypothetical protein
MATELTATLPHASATRPVFITATRQAEQTTKSTTESPLRPVCASTGSPGTVETHVMRIMF